MLSFPSNVFFSHFVCTSSGNLRYENDGDDPASDQLFPTNDHASYRCNLEFNFRTYNNFFCCWLAARGWLLRETPWRLNHFVFKTLIPATALAAKLQLCTYFNQMNRTYIYKFINCCIHQALNPGLLAL